MAWIMHFYIHSLPVEEEIRIPRGVTIPLLRICNQLQLPPVLTYSDDVLYNWALKSQPPLSVDDDQVSATPALDNLRAQTLFTGTRDEEEFYLASARIELRGVDLLELMRATMDEAFVGDDIALRRISSYLQSMATVIDESTSLLLAVREGCDPETFYNYIRPWFRGQDSDLAGRQWIFEGLDEDPRLVKPKELSGPSAGQSSLVHALDIFFGVEHGSSSSSQSWFDRMRHYMPRHHRNFLRHLSSNPRPLRAIVDASHDAELLESYNLAVKALKTFRDAHIRIVALYIVGPARRATDIQAGETLKGTGGTNLMTFLKSARDNTAGSIMSQ
jgi:indoleamine 2,3-dioxygenase